MVLEPLSRVRVAGPLEPFAVGFAGELGVQGYRGHQLRLMAHLSRCRSPGPAICSPQFATSFSTTGVAHALDAITFASWLALRQARCLRHHCVGRCTVGSTGQPCACRRPHVELPSQLRSRNRIGSNLAGLWRYLLSPFKHHTNGRWWTVLQL